MRRVVLLSLVLPAAACASAAAPIGQIAPQVDYHQHLVSPAFAPIVEHPVRNGAALIRELDAAGVQRAVVLSVGYSFADERKGLANPDSLTRAENDRTSAEVATTGGRLIGFCSANPLRDAALREIERCLTLPGMVGIKQHMGNAGVTLRDSSHLRRMKNVFALAQRRRAPVLVHMRARGGANYGAEDARLFLSQVVPQSPDIEIVVAHLGASGPGYTPQHDEVMTAFAEAVKRNDPHMRNVYFDVSGVFAEATTPDQGARAASRIREVGASRILYGSDLTPAGGSIRAGWEIFRTKVPLTEEEVRRIAGNRTRFAR